MDKRKYVALALEEELRSSRPRFNNHNSNTTTTPSKHKPNNNNNNPAPKPTKTSADQNVKEDPFKQVQGDELEDGDEDEDDDDGVKRPANAKRAGRRKIKIEYIQEKSRRHITFSKRKSGIMKKAFELSTLTGTQVLLLVVSETGLVYTFTTPKLQPIVTKEAGRNLIQACLHSADPTTTEGGAPGAGAGAGDDSRSDDGNDNDEPPQEEEEKANNDEGGSQQEAGTAVQGGGREGSSDHGRRGPINPTTTLATSSDRPSTSGPGHSLSDPSATGPYHHHPRYPHPPHGQAHTGALMYPPPYSHIPYPVTTSAPAGGPSGPLGPTGGGGGVPEGSSGTRPYWEYPYPGYGYSPYPHPPPPPPPPHHHHQHRPQHPSYPHPIQHVHHPQFDKSSGKGGLPSGPAVEALRKEE